MNRFLAIIACLAMLSAAQGSVIQFDISPPGTDVAVGLSPSNQVPAVTNSAASGNEISGGISFNTDTLELTLAIGFSNMSSPVSALHIHGPAGVGTNALPVVDLSPYLYIQGYPNYGGVIFGAVLIPTNEVDNLLAGLDYINVHTGTNPDGEIRGQLIPQPNNPPTVSCPAPTTAECGQSTTLTAQVSDPDGDELDVVWTVNGATVKTEKITTDTTTPVDTSFMSEFPLGTNTVTVTVSDSSTNSTSCNTTVIVSDTTAPMVVLVTASPGALWPPNHKMVDVAVEAIVTDSCSDTTWKIVEISSSESENGLGDGNTSTDWEITGPHTAKLRAERSGVTGPRTYTITIEATDDSGNVSDPATVTVTVAHDRGRGRK